MKSLIIVSPFGGFAKGERIVDPDQVEEILAGENAHHVVASRQGDEPETTKDEED